MIKYKGTVTERYFEISLKEAIERNKNRGASVPEEVIHNMYTKYIKNKEMPIRDVYFPKRSTDISNPLGLPEAIIVDIDGTLAINVSRNHYDMARVLEDAPNKPIIKLVRLLSVHYPVIIFSGRDSCEEDTRLWLNEHEVPFMELYMRQTGDTRKDCIVKEEMYRKNIEKRFHVAYIIDDRSQVVKMWRRIGLTCLQVNDGDF